MTLLPACLAGLLIFGLRVVDVTLGTMRTLTIIEGRIGLSMALGFLEVSVWVVAISQVITRLHESPWLILGYACGFAAGNAVGILAERRLALGSVVLRLMSTDAGTRIAEAFRALGHGATVFTGASNGAEIKLVYALCSRRDLPDLLAAARALDPEVFFVVERANQWGGPYLAAFQPSGWRAVWKKK